MRNTIRRVLAVAAVSTAVLAVSGCNSSDVSISSAEVSDNGTRLGLTLRSCNADLRVGVTEQDDQIVILASDDAAPLIDLGGHDCLDYYVVQLDDPLGDRDVIDGTTGSAVSVLHSLPDSGASFPYDRDRVTEDEYLKALDAMIACLEAADSEIDAWIYQDLNWKTYRWHKEADKNGYMTPQPALSDCHERHLTPLERPINSEWTEDDVLNAMGIWVNQTGLNQQDLVVWRDRLTEICTVHNAVGETTIELGDLALRYIQEDADVSVRADGTLPHVEEGAMALRQVADSPTCPGIEPDPNASAAWDPKAVMAPDEITADPAVAEPGALLAMSFPDGRMRGIHFVLESIDSDGVVTLAYHLVSDWGGQHEPRSFPADESDDFGIPDIALKGLDPDSVLIPADAPPGEYRLCTGNSRPNICTPLTIIPNGPGSMVDLLHHSLTIETGVPLAELVGELNIENVCITVSDGANRYLTIWPEGYRLQGDRVLDESGNVVAVGGTTIHFGGGESAAGLTGPVPDCGQTSFWLVTEVIQPRSHTREGRS